MVLRTLRSIASIYVVSNVIRSNVIDIELIHGSSMQPTFNSRSEHSLILVDKFSPRFNLIKTGDVIIAKQPNDSRYYICKRVSGMPTDEIHYHYNGNHQIQHLGKGHVWLLGDNARQSKDSRYFGPVPYNLIVSKVVLLLYPKEDSFWVRSVLHHSAVVSKDDDGNRILSFS